MLHGVGAKQVPTSEELLTKTYFEMWRRCAKRSISGFAAFFLFSALFGCLAGTLVVFYKVYGHKKNLSTGFPAEENKTVCHRGA